MVYLSASDFSSGLSTTDATGAGTGELVYWVRGKEATFPFLPAEPPVDTTIVGIVDEVHFQASAPVEPTPQPEPKRKGKR